MRIQEFLSKWNNLEPRVLEHFLIRPEQFDPRPRVAENRYLRILIEAGIDTTLGKIYDRVEGRPLHNYSLDAQKAVEDGLAELDKKLDARRDKLLSQANARPENGKPTAVILAGAGFSAGFGLPTTDRLAQFAATVCPYDHDHWWGMFHGDHESALAEGPLSQLANADKCPIDLENVLTVWDAFRQQWREARGFNSDVEKHHKGLLENLVAWFHHWSAQAESSEVTQARFLALAEWLRRTSERFNIRVITFNYDLIFERLCNAAGLPFRYIFSPPSADAVLIRKLHGSVNWFESQGEASTEPPSEFLGASHERYCYGVLTTDLPAYRPYGGPPLIIPPSGHKTYDAAFQTVWYWASHDIRNADRILVVGYSFPELDVLANTELRSRLRDWQETQKSELRYILPAGRQLSRIKNDVLCECGNVSFIESKWEPSHFEEWTMA